MLDRQVISTTGRVVAEAAIQQLAASVRGELRRLWRFVDQAGFDWLSVGDHLLQS